MESILKGYETTHMYTGISRWHRWEGEMNMPIGNGYRYRIGIELETIAKTETSSRKLRAMNTNWFHLEYDSSLGSDTLGNEIITIPLKPKDAREPMFWNRNLSSWLDSMAESWNRPECGLHVHVGREVFGNGEQAKDNIGKLLYLYFGILLKNHGDILKAVYGRLHTYHESELVSRYLKAIELLGDGVLKDREACRRIAEGLYAEVDSIRYRDINVQNPHTIEFRKGKGSISPDRIAGIITFSSLMCEYVVSTPWTQLNAQSCFEYIDRRANNPWLANKMGLRANTSEDR